MERVFITQSASVDRKALVQQYRKQEIVGKCMVMRPMQPEDAEPVVRIRNQVHARYYMTQKEEATVESHLAWYHEIYLPKEDDINWVILNRQREIVGGNALYDIDLTKGSHGEKGRQVIWQPAALQAPYALESDYLICRLALDVFMLEKVIACFKQDAARTESMNKRMGFVPDGERMLRGERYKDFSCRADQLRSEELESIINHWGKRI
ncbi:MAG TPA: GNAT family N-acetyltransferase [Kiritimatiellia bacterium]|mgnify:CR=1 FL=1|nr:GNAT family N-acetyltransferase [Kiritimatiellia bacterium]